MNNLNYLFQPLQCNEEDEEYESRVGRLLNSIGLELIKIINRCVVFTYGI